MSFYKILLLSLCLFINIGALDVMAKDKEKAAKEIKNVVSESKLNEQVDDYGSQVHIKLKSFVKYFVQEFEDRLLQYSLELDGTVKNQGKTAKFISDNPISKILFQVVKSVPVVGPTAVEPINIVVIGLADTIGEHYHYKHTRDLVQMVGSYKQGFLDFRKMLVRAGFDIFQSFEAQFMAISSEKGLHSLAVDAVNRAVNYSRNQKEFKENLIVQGVILGQSKKEFTTRGFNIRFNYKFSDDEVNKAKWNTNDLYSQVGIVLLNDEVNVYFCKKGARSCGNKPHNISDFYGYRRLLASEDWNEMKAQYEVEKAPKPFLLSDTYFLKTEDMDQEVQSMFEEINDEDNGFMEDRIKSKIEEVGDDISDQIDAFSAIYNKQTEISKKEAELREEYLKEIRKITNEILDIVKKK